MRHLPCALVVAALLAPSARAELTEGDQCRLSRPLLVKMRDASGVQTELARGTLIAIEKPGRFFTRVRAGSVAALAPRSPLEAACRKAQERCRVEEPLKMAADPKAGGEPRVFRVKAGAEVTVVERGERRARVLVDGVGGQVNARFLRERCRVLTDEPDASPHGSPATLPRGARVLVVPFSVGPGARGVDARAFEDALASALAKRRGDVLAPVEPRPGLKERRVEADAHVRAAWDSARALGAPYVLTGHVAEEQQRSTVSVTLLDVASGRSLKRVRAHPTGSPEDPWADIVSGRLHGALPKP